MNLQFTKFVNKNDNIMFGNMSDMMGKLQEAQKKIEETKQRLNTVFVDGESGDGLVVATVTANREIKNIAIDNSILSDKEELEDHLIIALNNAIAKASALNDQEMAAAAKDGMPNIPGLNL